MIRPLILNGTSGDTGELNIRRRRLRYPENRHPTLDSSYDVLKQWLLIQINGVEARAAIQSPLGDVSGQGAEAIASKHHTRNLA